MPAMPPRPSVASETPLDVLALIFTCLPAADLAVWCRVNRIVHPVAKKALYRALHPSRRNVLPLCLKLATEPDLADRVRSFTITDNTVDMFLGVIADALCKLPRLRALFLFIGAMSSWVLPRPDACPFQLHEFSTSFFFDGPLLSFLQSQSSLLHLRVSAPRDLSMSRAIRSPMFPHLVSIAAPMSVVEAVIPGRPVRNVTSYHFNHQPPSVSCFARSTSPSGVQRLMLNFTYLQTLAPDQLAEFTPNLKSFTIDADGVKPDDYEMVDQLTEWIEEYLSYARHLNCLIIRFYPALSSIPCQEIDFSDMITSIFAASEHLEHVIVLFNGVKAKYVCRQPPGQDWYIVND